MKNGRWKIFSRPERAINRVSDRFSDPFSRFSNRFSYRFKNVSGAVSFCTRAALTLLRSLAFALFCAHLHSFVLISVFLWTTAFRTTVFGNFRVRGGACKTNQGCSRGMRPFLGKLWNDKSCDCSLACSNTSIHDSQQQAGARKERRHTP